MSDVDSAAPNRRPLKTRRWKFFIALADRLAAAGVTANAISILGLAFCLAAGAVLALTAFADPGPAQSVLWVAAAALIQLRLMCNLLDGMVAQRSTGFSALGELYNEIPDRIADAAALVGAGFAAGSRPWLGFTAAVVAVFVAYVRSVGVAAGAGQQFCGPMAKPHRMATLTATCLCLAVTPEPWRHWGDINIIQLALGLIIVGSIVTAIRRLARIAKALRLRGGAS